MKNKKLKNNERNKILYYLLLLKDDASDESLLNGENKEDENFDLKSLFLNLSNNSIKFVVSDD